MKERIQQYMKEPVVWILCAGVVLLTIFSVIDLACRPDVPKVAREFGKMLERGDAKGMASLFVESNREFEFVGFATGFSNSETYAEGIVSAFSQGGKVTVTYGEAYEVMEDITAVPVMIHYVDGEIDEIYGRELWIQYIDGEQKIVMCASINVGENWGYSLW